MGYPRDLDEYEEEELRAELDRRAKLRADGKCDYCGRSIHVPTCKFQERHRRQKPPGRIVSYDEDGAPIRAD
jgi:hypothetical protein